MNDPISQNNISDNNSIKVQFPFSIVIDPMEKLLLVNFEKDPDSIYIGLEPQVFNDEINGSGHLVIAWRRDKKIDVYHESSLHLDPSKYNIAGAGLNKMVSVDMEKAYYEVNDFGVQAHYKFKDILGRPIEVAINEKNPTKRKPFGLLAPMGDAATNPTSLPLVLLQDFYFVRKKQTSVKIKIDNKSHKLDNLPIPIDFQKMTFARYSPKTLIATLNPAFNGELEALDLEMGQQIFEKGDYKYEIEWNNQSASIKSISIKNKIHLLTMNFIPSFPCLNTIIANTSYKGSFLISGHESVGVISGDYYIQSVNETITIRAIPSNGWKPKTNKLSLWFLFTVAKVFKKWPTTYQWDAELRKNKDGTFSMQSKWTRTGKILKD